jgi:MGT family glycosyltransferase
MSKILVATVPILGHVAPFSPLVKGLVAKGHEVLWYTGAKYAERAARAGARHLPYREARDFDDADPHAFGAQRSELEGLDQLRFDIEHNFIAAAEGQMRDLEAICATEHPDVILGDPCMLGGLLQLERGGVPFGVLGVLPYSGNSVDAAPFGLGLPPSATFFGRLRNRSLNWAVENVIFRSAQKAWDAARARVGLAYRGSFFDASRNVAFLIQPTIAALEYERSDLPSHVRFVGMLPAEPPASWTPPDFWHELDAGKPVVHVTQGTIANENPDLIAPTLAGLADLDVLVVVSTGNKPVASLKLGALPANARVAEFLSYPELLPRTAVMVTNGGYGGTQIALSYGVPCVIAGTTEDKPEVAMRVAHAGAGINLKTHAPTPEQVRAAVVKMLEDGTYKARAQALAAEYARHDALREAIAVIERAVFNTPATAQAPERVSSERVSFA